MRRLSHSVRIAPIISFGRKRFSLLMKDVLPACPAAGPTFLRPRLGSVDSRHCRSEKLMELEGVFQGCSKGVQEMFAVTKDENGAFLFL